LRIFQEVGQVIKGETVFDQSSKAELMFVWIKKIIL